MGNIVDIEERMRDEIVDKMGGTDVVLSSVLRNYYVEELVRGKDPVELLNIACGLIERQVKLNMELIMKMPVPLMEIKYDPMLTSEEINNILRLPPIIVWDPFNKA